MELVWRILDPGALKHTILLITAAECGIYY